jgi:hypothetical protein
MRHELTRGRYEISLYQRCEFLSVVDFTYWLAIRAREYGRQRVIAVLGQRLRCNLLNQYVLRLYRCLFACRPNAMLDPETQTAGETLVIGSKSISRTRLCPNAS